MELTKSIHTDLSRFNTGSYKAGSNWSVLLWYPLNYFIFNSSIPWPYSFKSMLLRLFGASIGKGLIIKTNVRIKNPWRLTIGDNCWIGESAWIDNLDEVKIGSNVCISQGAMLLTGNHDYTQSDFAYRLGKIIIEDGVWIGAQSVVCPGVTCQSHAVLTVNSVATKNLDAWSIYSGNPALYIRQRKISN
ncbi:WcaF family extracellular polysaccharide biosynthesis acetyltransferase [Pedobacter mucosus]|uniref:WcaF family extracellular polysaccharide biosynthesis acetyltransferase n=1 Tax=Pedobacter mucosus TaxID=2895286 RepID=UPI001EE4C9D3|nr:WcaF family extracellular polysaccharide biosynthesis acetyltransferase [Pedobacter mucosus]UKT62237.1 WcaF family extracellular polysaccharide biosynthesis acetyltransferase [Pedobacter mucosus]